MFKDKSEKDRQDDMQEFDEAVRSAERISRQVEGMKASQHHHDDLDDNKDDDYISYKKDDEADDEKRRSLDEKLRQQLSKKKKRTRAGRLIALALILVILIICCIKLFSCKKQDVFDYASQPSSVEAGRIAQIISENSFTAEIEKSSSLQKDTTKIDYDMRLGDFSLVTSSDSNELKNALYLRDKTLVKYYADGDSYTISDTGVNAGSNTPFDRRAEQIWEKFLRSSGRNDMKKPYEKLLKNFEKKLQKMSGKEQLMLLGKEKNLSIEQYSANGRDFAELLDSALDTFKPGDKLYDFVNLCCDEDFNIEDILDDIDDIRTRILRSDAQLVITKYYGGGFIGIGKKEIARRYSLRLNSNESYSYELFIKSYQKGKQFDKELTYEAHRNSDTQCCISAALQCTKIKSRFYSWSGSGRLFRLGNSDRSFTLSGDAEYQKDDFQLLLTADIEGDPKIFKMSADIHNENDKVIIDAQTYGSMGERVRAELTPANANTTFPTEGSGENVKLQQAIDRMLSGIIGKQED